LSTTFDHTLTVSLIYLLFFNDTTSTELYTLSLHDALPIFALPGSERERQPALETSGYSVLPRWARGSGSRRRGGASLCERQLDGDRKSTRLNSSHVSSSYAVFCLKKKKKDRTIDHDYMMYI